MSKITYNIESKIDKVFKHLKDNKVTFSDKDGGLSDSSVQKYSSVVKTYNNWLQKNYGISIDRSKPRHSYEYHEKIVTTGSIWTAKAFPHALHAFQEGSKGALGRHIKCGDKRVMMKKMNDQQLLRKSSESTNLKTSSKEYEAVIKALDSSKSSYKEYVTNVHEMQYKCGLRISESVKLKVGNIDFKNGTMTFKGKGGLERTVTVRDKEYFEKIKKLCEGKKPGSDVFRVQNKKGDPPSVNTRVSTAQREIGKAGDKAGVHTEKARYGSHSARKSYVADRVKEQKKKSPAQVKKEFNGICRDQKISKKAGAVLRHIRSKFKNPENQSKREFTVREMNLFMISCEIGHFRLDVMRFYTDY